MVSHVKWRPYMSLFQYNKSERDGHSLYENVQMQSLVAFDQHVSDNPLLYFILISWQADFTGGQSFHRGSS